MSAELVKELMAGTSGAADPEQWLIDVFGGTCAASGIRVNGRTALTYGPLYQAITMIADDLALLPVEVFKTDGEKPELDPSHVISRLWNVEVNRDMIPFDVRQSIMANCLLHGNGFGLIEYDSGRPVGIWPVEPHQVSLHRVPDTPDMREIGLGNAFVYRFTGDNGAGSFLFLHELFHVKMLGDGYWGHPPVSLFRDLIGNGMALEQFQGNTFSNGARPSGVLKKNYGPGIPTKLSPAARANLRTEWDQMHAGINNSGKIAILTDGLEFTPLSVTNEDAQMLESMKYSREQIAGIYKIPPHKMGAMQSTTFNNVAEQNRSYAQQTLAPLARKWEQESLFKLGSPRSKIRRDRIVKMDFKEMLRPDHKTRWELYSLGRQWGALSANDIRELEDMPDIGTQGDVYLVPSNMADAKTREPFSTPPQSAQPPASSGGDDDTTSEDSEDPPAESMVSYAREAMHQRQKIEIQELHHGMNRKEDFEKFCERFYADKFPDKLSEPLEPLVNVSGFVGPQGLDGAVQNYVSESFDIVRTCRSEKELAQRLAGFPMRIERFLHELRAK